jgi:glycosyltransferase involved in cell wall biosynthesis
MHALNYNLIGILEMKRCYLNTQAQKELVLEEAGKILSVWNCKKLDEILTVQHPGIRKEDIVEEPLKETKKIIAFNHRPATYKDFDNFIKTTDELWKQRQDFKVWIPLLDSPTRPYIYVDKFDKIGYYNELRRCRVGYSPEQQYGGWSVATTDGIMNGTPFIMYDAPYYKELNPTGDFFKNNDDAIKLLNLYLNDTVHRNNIAGIGLKHLKNNLIYENEMKDMLEYFDKIVSSEKCVTDRSKRLKEMVEQVEKEGRVTKEKLTEWIKNDRPYGVALTPYRRALLKHPNIYDSDGVEPQYIWKKE